MFPTLEDALAAANAAASTLAEIAARSVDGADADVALRAMRTLQNHVESEVTRVVGAFDVHGDPGTALTTAAWVAWKCRLRKSDAKATVARARALRHMPTAAQAYEAGEISSDHVRLLAAAKQSNGTAFAAAEEERISDVRGHRPGRRDPRSLGRHDLQA